MGTKTMARVMAAVVLSAGVVLGAGMWGGAVSARPQVTLPSTAGQSPAMQSSQQEIGPARQDHDPAHERMKEQAIVSANAARHKRMVEDVNKLLDLSTQLKDDVDKTADDQLSVEVIRKATEVEKLAHDVKERMRQ